MKVVSISTTFPDEIWKCFEHFLFSEIIHNDGVFFAEITDQV